ncbi:probable beta-D-xylosidase 6 [Diospyros lotus]|uniref:probable beta-D-xylosidase 6 n=1 Tax=Diospyros lotus TaxID=55363 RepID=UPI0022590031|nr:probable beta-D-xylosidase 6 [Diospyros lotus]
MSANRQWSFLLFFQLVTIIIPSLSHLGFATPPATAISSWPQARVACNPPHNTYPFCNTSLSVTARAQSLISLLTLPEKVPLLVDNATAVPRLGIPAYDWWCEALHGVGDLGPGVTFNGLISSATSFPQVIVTGSSFNRTLWYKIASATAVEARALFNVGQAGLTFWAPNINIFRDPRWGRGQETTGEDPLVAAAYAVEFVKGFQGEDRRVGSGNGNGFGGERRELEEEEEGGLMASACCKHYTAYDMDEWGSYERYNFDAVVSQQDLEDTYQPPFKSCVQDGKASCLMCSYNSLNGIPTCARKDILEITRKEWGFKGYITSDCGAVFAIHERYNYTKTAEEAIAAALDAGMDIECGPYISVFGKSAVAKGKLKEAAIDRALLNLFSVQIRLGLFDGDPATANRKYGSLGPGDVCTAQHNELALEAARQGTVLLKNDNRFLPLIKHQISSLAIIGPMANNKSSLGGDYAGVPCRPKSILDGFESYAKKITYAAGCTDGVPCKTREGFNEALSIAKEAEVVIVVAGLDTSQETELLDRYSLLLPGYQMDLVTEVASVVKRPLILILTGGGPVDVSFAKSDSRIASILWIGYPGETGGKAVAEIIFGDYNPGGRLLMTWYPESFTSISMADMNMRPDPSRGYPGRTHRFYNGDKIYEFGHGLSYTNFTYTLLSAPNKLSVLGPIRATSRKANLHARENELNYVHVDDLGYYYCDSLIFNTRVSVMNNGNRDGSHVVLLFSKGPKPVAGAPQKQLIGFDRVHTVSHESTETGIVVNPCQHLSYADVHGRRILPLGNHTLMLSDHIEHVISIEI